MTLPLRATPNRQRIVFTASPEEPGEPMVLSGAVCGADGRTSLEGGRLYLYHTDAQGYYLRPRNDRHRPRSRG
jgi:protocatechuate 3,4-dioxygenase beta subunit